MIPNRDKEREYFFKKAEAEEKKIKEFIKNNLSMNHNDGTSEVKYNHPKGTFMWAVEQIKQGKKVVRGSWALDMSPIYLSEKKIYYAYKRAEFRFPFVFEDFEAIDWQIYEENKFGFFEADGETIWIVRNNERILLYPKDIEDLEKAINYVKNANKENTKK